MMRRYEHHVSDDLARYDRATSDGERRALHVLALRALHEPRGMLVRQAFSYGLAVGLLLGVAMAAVIAAT